MTAIKFAGTVLGALAFVASPAAAQSVSGTAFGSYVNALGVTAQSPVASLPSSGGMAVGDAGAFGVPNAVDARWLKAITTGAADDAASSAQSTSELEQVNVLGGVITADIVTAVASSYRNAGGMASDATGSGFVNLVVNGVTLATDVAPNTRIDLPGVGYAVLNEQRPTGDGVSTSGITVNMIHVYLQGVSVLGVATTTGEIIVGSANSAVSR